MDIENRSRDHWVSHAYIEIIIKNTVNGQLNKIHLCFSKGCPAFKDTQPARSSIGKTVYCNMLGHGIGKCQGWALHSFAF